MDYRDTAESEGNEGKVRDIRSLRFAQECLNEIESIVTGGQNVLVGGRRIVDSKRILELIVDLRDGMPDSFRVNEQFYDRRNEVIGDAQRKADKMIRAATSDAERARNEASQYYDETINEANERAEKIVANADSYAKATESGALEKARVIEATAEANREKLISESSIVNGARQEADRIMKESRAKAEEMRSMTDEACRIRRKEADDWANKIAGDAYNYVMNVLKSSAQHYAASAADVSARIQAIQDSVKR